MFKNPALRTALIVVLVSASVRLIWTANATITPVSDFAGYHALAKQILSEGSFGREGGQAYRTPAYPLFLAAIYAVFGAEWKNAAFVQALMSAVTSGLLVLLATRVVSVRAACIAGLLHALWPTSLAYVPSLASENLAEPLVVLGILLLAVADDHTGARQKGLIAASGAACGLLLLARPAGLLFVPAWLLLSAYSLRKRAPRPVSGALFLMSVMIVVGPWLIRNHKIGLGITTLATTGGVNLHMGNNDLARHGGWNSPALFLEWDDLPESERNAKYAGLALQWIQSNPGRYLQLCMVRLARYMGTVPDGWAALFLQPTHEVDRAHLLSIRQRTSKVAAANLILADFKATRRANARYLEYVRIIVAPLTLAALLLSFGRWRDWAPIVGPAACYVAGICASFGGERFRVLSDPFLLILLGALLSDLFCRSNDLSKRASLAFKWTVVAICVHALLFAQTTGVIKRAYELAPYYRSTPDVRDFVFVPVELTDSGDAHRSAQWTRGVAAANTSIEDSALHCDIVGSDDTSASQYAGVKFPVNGLSALRFELAIKQPESIRAIFVDGYDAKGRRQPLWSWDFNGDTLPTGKAVQYTLVPGQHTGYFVARSGADVPGLVEIQVFVLVAANSRCGFTLQEIEFAGE